MYLTDDDLAAMVIASMIEDQDGLAKSEVKEPSETKQAPRYPLTNIVTDNSTETLFIEIACAGFSKEMIQVELVEDFGIVVHGTYVTDDDPEAFTYHQQNISQKDFVRKIQLDETYMGESMMDIDFVDGLLTIMIQKAKPAPEPEPKRKFIDF